MKKILFILLSFLPLTLNAEEYSGTTGDCTWHLDTETGVMTISSNGRMGDYNSTAERPWNDYVSFIKTVIIEEGVTSIGHLSFYYCYNLNSVKIPSTVTYIGNYAFYYCLRLNSVISYITEPFELLSEQFAQVGYFSVFGCTLYVFTGMHDAYIAAGWTEEIFKGGIVEIDIVKLSANAAMVYTDEEPVLNIDFERRKDIIMAEFYFHLPDGIDITTDENDNYDVTLNPERVSDHVIEVVRNSEGVYHFFCYSPTNAPFIGETGNLMTVNLVHNENIGYGTFPAKLTSILFSDNQLEGISQDNLLFNIQFKAFMLGDVNDDTRFNGLDLVEIVNHIMNRPSVRFVKHAADFDKNGVVNGMDLIEEVELLLSQVETNGAKSREQRAEILELPSIPLRLDNKDGNMSLAVESSDDFILAQFILQLSEEQTLNSIDTDMNHVVAYKAIGDNRYAVLCYSMRNEVFMSNDNVMNLSINGKGDVSVRDALFINADMQECWVGAANSGDATGITEIDCEFRQPVNIYSVGGQLIKKDVTSIDNLPHGIFILNGKKYIKR